MSLTHEQLSAYKRKAKNQRDNWKRRAMQLERELNKANSEANAVAATLHSERNLRRFILKAIVESNSIEDALEKLREAEILRRRHIT